MFDAVVVHGEPAVGAVPCGRGVDGSPYGAGARDVSLHASPTAAATTQRPPCFTKTRRETRIDFRSSAARRARLLANDGRLEHVVRLRAEEHLVAHHEGR